MKKIIKGLRRSDCGKQNKGKGMTGMYDKLSPLVGAHVMRKAKKMNIPLPDDWKKILFRELDCFKENKIRIAYSWLWDSGGRVPNASSTIPRLILVNAEWAAMIVLLQNDEKMHDAFRLTIGHEMTHQNDHFFLARPFSKNARFTYWVNEVHADFGGAVMAFEGDVARCAEAMQFKKKCKGERDRDGYSHPSWRRRIEYIRDNDFNRELIYKIANITGCKNESLIEHVCDQYKDIKLKRLGE